MIASTSFGLTTFVSWVAFFSTDISYTFFISYLVLASISLVIMYVQSVVNLVIFACIYPLTWALPFAIRALVANMTPVAPSQAEIMYELGPMLSREASIYFPGSRDFGNATERWNAYVAPDIRVVVEAGNDDDVALTVRRVHS